MNTRHFHMGDFCMQPPRGPSEVAAAKARLKKLLPKLRVHPVHIEAFDAALADVVTTAQLPVVKHLRHLYAYAEPRGTDSAGVSDLARAVAAAVGRRGAGSSKATTADAPDSTGVIAIVRSGPLPLPKVLTRLGVKTTYHFF